MPKEGIRSFADTILLKETNGFMTRAEKQRNERKRNMDMKDIIKAYVQERNDELVKTMIESMEGKDPKKLFETIHGVTDIIELTLSVIPSVLAPIYAMIIEQSYKAICSDPEVAKMKDDLKKAIGIQAIGITVPRGGSEK